MATTPYTFGYTATDINHALSFLGMPTTVEIPDALGWDHDICPVTVTVNDVPGIAKAFGSAGITSKALFNMHSTALSAPTNTYYVNITTGLDTNGGTSGAPFKSINKAMVAANESGQPATIVVASASNYTRPYNFVQFINTEPLVDIAFLADGNRITVGLFDQYANPSIDGTYTNTYSQSLASVARVLDLYNVDRFGDPDDMYIATTPTICDGVGNSWNENEGTTYINRRDKKQVDYTNTRILRTGRQFKMGSQVSIYMGPLNDDAAGFDFFGGGPTGTNGVFDALFPTPSGSVDAIILDNCSFGYGYRGISIDSFNGIAAQFNCRAYAGDTDGFNFHNTFDSSNLYALAVNCRGYKNGRDNASSNGFTLHDDNVIGIDICGQYEGNHGGSVRNVGTSKCLLAGTYIKDDFGDRPFGNSTQPTAVRAESDAVIWADRVKIDARPGTYGLSARGNGVLYKRNIWQNGTNDDGNVIGY